MKNRPLFNTIGGCVLTVGFSSKPVILPEHPVPSNRESQWTTNSGGNNRPDVFHIGFCCNRKPCVTMAALAYLAVAGKVPILELPNFSDIPVMWHFIDFRLKFDEQLRGALTLAIRSRSSNDSQPLVQALLGCDSSIVTDKIAAVTGMLRTVQVGWYTIDDSLSDKIEFPFFLRTLPLFSQRGPLFVRLCVHFRWKRVGFLYQQRTFVAVHVEIIKQARTVGLDVISFALDEANNRALGDHQLASWKHKLHEVLTVFGTGFQVLGFTCVAYHMDAFLDQASAQGFTMHLLISLSTRIKAKIHSAWNGLLAINRQDFDPQIADLLRKQWSRMNFANLTSVGMPPMLVDDLRTTKPDLFKEPLIDAYYAHGFDAVVAVLSAVQRLRGSGLPLEMARGDVLLQELYKTAFRGASGYTAFTKVVDGTGGDGAFATYQLQQIQKASFVTLGTFHDDVIVVSKSLVFPDGSNDPTHYNPQPHNRFGLCGRYTVECKVAACVAAVLFMVVFFVVIADYVKSTARCFCIVLYLALCTISKLLRSCILRIVDRDRLCKEQLDAERGKSEMLGVSLEYLLGSFEQEVALVTNQHDPNFHELAPILLYGPRARGYGKMCPRDRQPGCSFVDSLQPSLCGEATHFLSWCWSYKVSIFVSALHLWCAEDQLEPSKVFIWICALCNNQFRLLQDGLALGADQLEATFEKRLLGIGRMLVMIDCFEDPHYIKRVWCVYEIFTAVKMRLQMTVILPQAGSDSFQELLLHHDGVRKALCAIMSINVAHASAWSHDDEVLVKSKIRATVGFTAVNEAVKKFLQDWCGAQFANLMSRNSVLVDFDAKLAENQERRGLRKLFKQRLPIQDSRTLVELANLSQARSC